MLRFKSPALTLMAMQILGMAAMRSHLCHLLEKAEIAPTFAMICSIESVSRVAATVLTKVSSIELLPEILLRKSIVMIGSSSLLHSHC